MSSLSSVPSCAVRARWAFAGLWLSLNLLGVHAATEIRLVHYGPDNHPAAAAAKMLAENVEARTKGAIHVQVIGNASDVFEQVQAGAADMALVAWDMMAKQSKYANAVGIPFLFRDYAHADAVLDGEFRHLAAAELEPQGLVLLQSWEWGFRQITTSRSKVIKPGDLKGLRIRTPPAFAFRASMTAFGALPVALPFSELNQALSSNFVDGEENPIAVIYDRKLFENQKYVAMVNYVYTSMAHVVVKKIWDGLSKEQQAIIREESQHSASFMRKRIRDDEAWQIAEMKKSGVEFTKPDLAAFKAAIVPVHDQLRHQIGDVIYDHVLSLSGK